MNQLFRETRESCRNTSNLSAFNGTGINLVDEENAFLLEIAIPGLTKKDVAVTVEDNNLLITAEKKEDTERNYVRRGFVPVKFSKSYKLSDNINEEEIFAEVKDGLLLVTLPKIEKEESKLREIEIR